MDKNLACLLGAVGALAAAGPAAAAASSPVADAMRAASYADLLRPIPNALAVLKAAEAEPAVPSDGAEATFQEAQLIVVNPHHHHHRFFRRRFRRHYHHHHHHHHHNQG